MDSYRLEVAKKSYPKEVLFYSVKYSPLVISFDFDDTEKNDYLIFNIKSNIDDYDILYGHLMERIQFSFLRYEISQKTQTERDLIVGRALYRSCIKVTEDE